jgi:Peptidase family M28/PDZ domain
MEMINMKFGLTIALAFIFKMSFSQSIEIKNLKKHIGFLASDKLDGRGTSSKGEAASAQYIAAEFKKMKLLPKGNKGYFHEFTFKKANDIHGMDTVGAVRRNSKNVVGYLDNGAENTIVIGAHYDHLGLAEDGSSLDANPKGKIHNGADDNASGTAGVIELARYFSTNKVKEKYNFLFTCFSGEELGLIGSKKLIESNVFNWIKVNYMINMDMVGRLNDSTNKLLVYGIGTAKEWGTVFQNVKSDFKFIYDSSGVGPSDHTSFYLKDMPVLHFFTGQHMDYHKPSDDIEKINFVGEQKVLQYIVGIVEASNDISRLTFQKTRTTMNDKVSFKVTLGVMPDYAFEGPGMRVDGVTDGKPAFKAGLQKGDVILRMDDKEIKDVMTYTKLLSTYKKGDKANLKIKRAETELNLEATF